MSDAPCPKRIEEVRVCRREKDVIPQVQNGFSPIGNYCSCPERKRATWDAFSLFLIRAKSLLESLIHNHVRNLSNADILLGYPGHIPKPLLIVDDDEKRKRWRL
jgi:hypothetical protein